jgi:hypothetical protein
MIEPRFRSCVSGITPLNGIECGSAYLLQHGLAVGSQSRSAVPRWSINARSTLGTLLWSINDQRTAFLTGLYFFAPATF